MIYESKVTTDKEKISVFSKYRTQVITFHYNRLAIFQFLASMLFPLFIFMMYGGSDSSSGFILRFLIILSVCFMNVRGGAELLSKDKEQVQEIKDSDIFNLKGVGFNWSRSNGILRESISHHKNFRSMIPFSILLGFFCLEGYLHMESLEHDPSGGVYYIFLFLAILFFLIPVVGFLEYRKKKKNKVVLSFDNFPIKGGEKQVFKIRGLKEYSDLSIGICHSTENYIYSNFVKKPSTLLNYLDTIEVIDNQNDEISFTFGIPLDIKFKTEFIKEESTFWQVTVFAKKNAFKNKKFEFLVPIVQS